MIAMVADGESTPLDALTSFLVLWWKTINKIEDKNIFKMLGGILWHLGNLPSKVIVTPIYCYDVKALGATRRSGCAHSYFPFCVDQT